MPRIAFFEDSAAADFAPIALLRPVFELLCGHFSNRERLLSRSQETGWGAFIRGELAEVYQSEHPSAVVNDEEWLREEPVLLINGRCLISPETAFSLMSGEAAWMDETPVAILLSPSDKLDMSLLRDQTALHQFASRKKPVQIDGTLLNYPWDLINANPRWLQADFHLRDRPAALGSLDPRVAIIGPVNDVFIDATARLDPFVVIDATGGPVWIDRDARIQAFTRIEGPAWIGPETQLFRANVREGCSFGPVCRIGGEIEESIVHGYSNKYHDGFLGHSYVAPWVNLGALTTNSDLKSDYSPVSVPLSGQSLPTGTTKVGCFIGDHTKTALCSLMNTGSSIGVMSLILPAGELLPKHIPSFTRFWHGQIEALPESLESSFQTARVAMSRRNCQFTPAMERLLYQVFAATTAEREQAVQRKMRR